MPSGDTPVFGMYRPGKTSGKAKGVRVEYRGASFAKTLRRALKRAGVTREALFKPTFNKLPVDFHSCRRAFATGLARAGVNEQQQKLLMGHHDEKTSRSATS